MDAYQVRTWEGWHHHMALSLIAVWFLLGETHRGQQLTPALTLPQVRYGLSMLLLEVFCTLSVPSICRHVHRQLLRNELARFYHHRTRNCIPPKKLRRDIQLGIGEGTWFSRGPTAHGACTLTRFLARSPQLSRAHSSPWLHVCTGSACRVETSRRYTPFPQRSRP